MREYRFAQFRFDAVRCQLYAGKTPVALRPKTAALLGVLLARAGQAVAKAELIDEVWQRRQVQDQSLFQAICELRAALKPLDAIRTHPNLGYAWVQPLEAPRQPTRHLAYAAGIALMLVANGAALLAMAPRATPPAPRAETPAPMIPALHAFSLGMEEMQQAHFEAAASYFTLAVREHPDFLEAQLMAAEASLANGDLAAARERAHTLMGEAQLRDNGYLLVAALDVLSRAALAQGHEGPALDLARTAAGNAREEGFACAAVAMEARVASLASALAPDDRPDPAPSALEETALAAERSPAHCAAITPRTSRLHEAQPCPDPLPAASGRTWHA